MAQFHRQGFSHRHAQMGDEAEGIFEEVYPQKFVRYGLNRPPIHMASVPAFVRYTPDYLTAKGLVEVQGFGRDQVAKFKVAKLENLFRWHQMFRVDFFLWDSKNRRFGWLRLPELIHKTATGSCRAEEFHEGNPYWAIPADALPVVEWIEHGDALAVTR